MKGGGRVKGGGIDIYILPYRTEHGVARWADGLTKLLKLSSQDE